MRIGDKATFIDNGKKSGHHKVIGVCLGADFAAEHEQGVGPLRRSFGSTRPSRYAHFPDGPSLSDYEVWKKERDDKLAGVLGSMLGAVGVSLPYPPLPEMGLAKRKVTKIPAGFSWHKSTDGSAEGFGFSTYNWRTDAPGVPQNVVDDHAAMRRGDDLVGAWDNKSFLVLARSEKARSDLQKLYDSIMECDAVLTMPMGFLQVQGLCIVRASDYPADAAKKMAEDDLDTFIGEKAFDETGIEAELRAKSKRWFSLGSNFGRGQRSKPVSEWTCWLNPMDQDIHNYGAFTIAELRLWGDDKGPIMRMRQQQKRSRW